MVNSLIPFGSTNYWNGTYKVGKRDGWNEFFRCILMSISLQCADNVVKGMTQTQIRANPIYNMIYYDRLLVPWNGLILIFRLISFQLIFNTFLFGFLMCLVALSVSSEIFVKTQRRCAFYPDVAFNFLTSFHNFLWNLHIFVAPAN